MYITGKIADFSSRMHQLTLDIPSTVTGLGERILTGTANMQSFIAEGQGYIATYGIGTGIDQITIHESGKWEKEARKLNWQLSGNALGMLKQVF